ncbi:MAG: hypothetical protein F4089_11140 [Gammaproteobacteria bacterium]|nr:hypothetical protein [Gammaproteobacteria bacterium]MYJ75607.1 hypothetical protein [Gammaproteobacteria bacterium]
MSGQIAAGIGPVSREEEHPHPAAGEATARSRKAGDARDPRTSSAETVEVEAFDPETVRPWKFHNRAGSGMDDASLSALAASIDRDGQQQPGLARRLPPGDSHVVEAIFGIRRLEACRRAGTLWRAEVREASFPDAECAALMHGENAWSEGVSPLENAVQWKAMLDAGVFKSQTALAAQLGCARNTVSRAIITATALFGEEWLARLVRPVMHEFTGRSAERLAHAYAEGSRRQEARKRAEELDPGQVSAQRLHDVLFAPRARPNPWKTVFTRRRGRTGGGSTVAKIERNEAGGWSVTVRPHHQSPSEMAELAEQVRAIVDTETAEAAAVRLGRRLTTMLTPEEAKSAERSWLEGCVWTAAHDNGLDWDRWQSAVAADILRAQTHGWERAVARAVGGRGADPSGA